MAHEREERRRLRQYILDELTDREQERVEKDYFRDPDRRERLWLVFDEMARDYLGGRLRPAMAAKFERRLTLSPALALRMQALREPNE